MTANGLFLSDEQRMIRDMARDFAEGELAPHAGNWDLNGGYPDDILPRMGQLGLMGMLVPPEWDGAGAVPFRRHQHPHEPELAHAGENIVRIAAVQVPIARVRRELALGEVARHVADHPLLVAEEEAVGRHGVRSQSRS